MHIKWPFSLSFSAMVNNLYGKSDGCHAYHIINIELIQYKNQEFTVFSAFGLLLGRRSLSGSPIGGIAETQEMLDFCSEHNITGDVEVIPIQRVNEAYDRLLKSDVKYRFSIDMASLKSK